MSITDELREWAKRFWGCDGKSRHASGVLAIADRIDAEHERLCSRSRSNGYNDGFTDGFNDIESWVVDHEDEMAEHGWVKLPKDADGEYIHMGDLVTVPWKDKVYEVAGFSCSKQLCSGIRTIWIDVYSPEKQRNVPLCGADSCRHYHAPTVEDVLREMADRCYADEDEPRDRDAIVAEYAAKLRLVGDE